MTQAKLWDYSSDGAWSRTFVVHHDDAPRYYAVTVVLLERGYYQMRIGRGTAIEGDYHGIAIERHYHARSDHGAKLSATHEVKRYAWDQRKRKD